MKKQSEILELFPEKKTTPKEIEEAEIRGSGEIFLIKFKGPGGVKYPVLSFLEKKCEA